jgi:hypothetical protein
MATETVSLEQSPLDEPPLARIKSELEQAQSDSSSYLQRIALSQNWWQCQWNNMWDDGRMWGNDCFPWNGASDSRLHIVETIVQEHVTLDLVAFWSANANPFAHSCTANSPVLPIVCCAGACTPT